MAFQDPAVSARTSVRTVQIVAKTVMYEESVKIPWLMRIPQMGRKRRVIDQPVSHIDLIPTLLDLMGARAQRPLPGHSLVPRIQGGKLAEDHVFIQWNPGQGAMTKTKGIDFASPEELQRVARESTRTVVSPDGWKLCLSDLDKCQLFNLNEDPGETTNLFDSGRHQDVINRLTKRIHQWQESAKDTATV